MAELVKHAEQGSLGITFPPSRLEELKKGLTGLVCSGYPRMYGEWGAVV